jgi:3-phytase
LEKLLLSFSRLSVAALLAPWCLSACATPLSGLPGLTSSLPAVNVAARGQTVPVGTPNQDAADDPAIWRNSAEPAASLIVGTDKKAGLYVYDLDGQIKDFNNAGKVNNVDLRGDVAVQGKSTILVVASDRNDLAQSKLALFSLNPATAKLVELGKVDAGAGEAYGICLYRDAVGLYAFMVLKDGTVNQVRLDTSGAVPTGQIVRTMKLATQSEGCVADEATGQLYVAEEDVGLWRFEAAASAATTPIMIAPADGKQIVADAEGVALAHEGTKAPYVIVSSQGDNAYAVYRTNDNSFVGRFRIKGGAVGSTEETDGIELITGDFGPKYPGGLFIAQDGHNAKGAQNFKLVAWDDIKAALGLKD